MRFAVRYEYQTFAKGFSGEPWHEMVRFDVEVFGWSWRRVGFLAGETIVPQILTVAGERVTSISHLRIAKISPIRPDGPSITSMICSN